MASMQGPRRFPLRREGCCLRSQLDVPSLFYTMPLYANNEANKSLIIAFVLTSQVPAGQSINISLWDFGLKVARNRTLASSAPNGIATKDINMAAIGNSQHKICRVYATIKEKSLGRSITVCGGRSRHQHVYTSDTNEVEIRILSGQAAPPSQTVYFILQYQGNDTIYCVTSQTFLQHELL